MMDAPIRDKTKLGTYTTLIVGGFAVLSYILRAVARLPYFGGNWGLDDWAISAAIVSCQTFSRLVCYNLQYTDIHHSAHHLRICL